MIDGLTNSEALPVLERMMQFAGARHRLIANNLANIDTPGYRMQDVSVKGFQARLAQAIDQRRSGEAPAGRPLVFEDEGEAQLLPDRLVLRPGPTGENILFHDQNDRDVERITQDLVENFMVFRTAAEFMRSHFDLINTAIRERM